MLEQILVAAVGVGILALAYLLDLIVGIVKVAFTPDMKWSWSKWGKDLLKMVMIAVCTVGFVALLNVVGWYLTNIGVDMTILDSVSVTTIFAAVGGGVVWYMIGAGKNLIALLNKNNQAVTIDTSKANYEAIAEQAKKIINDVADLFTPKEVVESHKDFEETGAQGYAYSVPIDSYDSFRNTVIGKSYDIDGYYGAQCWDGAALLWQQIGRTLSTGGTGAAKGCWTVVSARNSNAGADFDLVTNVNSLKRGDVIVFGNGTYGHIAFVDQVSPLRILGQNQTGTGNGAPFNIINTSTSGFLGAFRFKKWNKAPAPQPTPPAPTPTPTPKPEVPNNPTPNTTVNVGDSVIAWGVGTGDSYGGGAKTKNFGETTMKVIGKNNGRYALNQYNRGAVGNVADVTGWWTADQVRKA